MFDRMSFAPNHVIQNAEETIAIDNFKVKQKLLQTCRYTKTYPKLLSHLFLKKIT